ncbi:MAG: glycosyltransferase [Candidatus Aminicenantes bacterium]|nr:glycosyltransferase [Candidatus Aminicenantes bacterium]
MSLFQVDAGKEWRGGQRQSFFLAKELKRKDYPFQFVVQPESPLHRKAYEARLPVFPLKIKSEFDIPAILRLSKAMRRKKCPLVHFHDAHSTAVGAVAASLAKVPLRLISRRVDFPLNKNYFSRFKYTKNVDAIIPVSEGVKKVLVEGGIDPEIIKVIPDGIDYTVFEEASSSNYLRHELSFSPDDYLVGIVAHLADHKGHKYLVKAARILKERAPKIKIIIVGEGPLMMELSKQVKEIQVEDIIFFLGFREDVPQILASLDLFVLSSYLEGLGSSLLDAMASKLPIVATKVGGVPELVINNKTGLLVPPRNPSALAKAILKLYNDRALASYFGQRGYELVHQKFSAEAMADKIIALYEKLAKKKRIRLRTQN